MEDEVIALLQKLGFSKSEALVYVTLLKHGPLTARALSDLSGVPYSKVYTILESLSRKGFVTIIEERPRLYLATDPEETFPSYIDSLIHEIKSAGEKALKKLREIYANKAKIEERRVMLIRDPSLIAAKVAEAIRRAKTYVKLSGPDRLVLRLKEELAKAVKRGVKVYVLSPSNPDIKGVKRKYLPLTAGGLIVDGKEVIILLKEGDSFIALYSNHPSLTVLAETYYDNLRSQGTS